jgi:hypothetical protein
VSEEVIHDRHQVEETLLERDVGDIGGPGLIHYRDHAEIHQAEKELGWMLKNVGAWFLIDRP